ncbi:MAG: hypothetical protein AAF542_17835 [Pseudomonadota bacterium]
MSVIDNIKARKKERVEALRKKCEFEPWGLEFYLSPMDVSEGVALDGCDETVAGAVEMFIVRCKDADGKPIFKETDRNTMIAETLLDDVKPLVDMINAYDKAESDLVKK